MKKLLTIAALSLLLSACQTTKPVDPAAQAEMDYCARATKDNKAAACCKDGMLKKDLTAKELKKCQKKVKQCAAKKEKEAAAAAKKATAPAADAKADAKKAAPAKATAKKAAPADKNAKDAKPADKK